MEEEEEAWGWTPSKASSYHQSTLFLPPQFSGKYKCWCPLLLALLAIVGAGLALEWTHNLNKLQQIAAIDCVSLTG